MKLLERTIEKSKAGIERYRVLAGTTPSSTETHLGSSRVLGVGTRFDLRDLVKVGVLLRWLTIFAVRTSYV